MPTIESMQHRLDTVRPPRVQITYDVETGGAIEEVQLPFVMGILADLTGDNADKTPLKNRKFVEIDRDNFTQVMRGLEPGVSFTVENPLSGATPSELAVDLSFSQIDDFNPANVVRQVPELNALLQERQRLRDLLTKQDSSEDWLSALNTLSQR